MQVAGSLSSLAKPLHIGIYFAYENPCLVDSMKAKIIKPPIPIIFIDTFFFIDLIANRHRDKKSSYFTQELELIDLIEKLTRERKLLCPQGDQDEEYELGLKYEDEIRQAQVRLSLGISAMYHYGVYKYQSQVAISAYLKKEKEVVYDYRSLFQREPLKELEEALAQRFIVSVHLPKSKSFLDSERKTKKELAEEFEKNRRDKIKSGTKFKEAYRRELLGKLEAIIHSMQTAIPKLANQLLVSEAENNGLMVLGDYLSYISHYSGKEATLKDVVEFLSSEYYASIPFISTQSKLYASLLTQQNSVKDSDNFDFQQASQILPFSTYFLTDSSLKHRFISNPLSLDKEYNVKIYSMKDIRDLIKDLNRL